MIGRRGATTSCLARRVVAGASYTSTVSNVRPSEQGVHVGHPAKLGRARPSGPPGPRPILDACGCEIDAGRLVSRTRRGRPMSNPRPQPTSRTSASPATPSAAEPRARSWAPLQKTARWPTGHRTACGRGGALRGPEIPERWAISGALVGLQVGGTRCSQAGAILAAGRLLQCPDCPRPPPDRKRLTIHRRLGGIQLLLHRLDGAVGMVFDTLVVTRTGAPTRRLPADPCSVRSRPSGRRVGRRSWALNARVLANAPFAPGRRSCCGAHESSCARRPAVLRRSRCLRVPMVTYLYARRGCRAAAVRRGLAVTPCPHHDRDQSLQHTRPLAVSNAAADPG